ncbi:hypothetical protein [Asticcacaulis sp. 201]|uniref:hypothetical protein n=1 Tax=Asticcacaulis sp. 201 TaxID=3028787 RepID=UPI002916E151|nr:hypothetical protein [Asticcacaulis sp. 201]MDV6333093.1 hypothetical protein [Asticcacaulis sp. 201]
MFRFDFTLTRVKPARARFGVSEDAFKRKLDTSDTLRHLCGFDTELYRAINDLRN